MRTQGQVLALVKGCVGGLTVMIDSDARDVRVTDTDIRLPAPPLLATDAESELYRDGVYKAVALSKHADSSAFCRDAGGKLSDPLAYEIGLRYAQAAAAGDWDGDKAVLRAECSRIAGVLKNADWERVSPKNKKDVSASVAALTYSGAADSASAAALLAALPLDVREMVASLRGIPDVSSKDKADWVRAVLKYDDEEDEESSPPPSGGGGGGAKPPEDEEGEDKPEGAGASSGDEEAGDDAAPASDDAAADGDDHESDSGESTPNSEEQEPEHIDISPTDYAKDIKQAIPEDKESKRERERGDYITTAESDVIYHSYEHSIPHRNCAVWSRPADACRGRVPAIEDTTLSREMRKLVQVEERVRYEGGKMSGRLDSKALYRVGMPQVGDGTWNATVFRKKHAPKNTQRTAVSVLVDYSGSMSGSRTRNADMATRILSSALSQLRVEHCVRVFTEGRNRKAMEQHACLEIGAIKEWGKRVPELEIGARMAHFVITVGQKQNGDPCAIAYTYADLIRRKEPRKVMIVLSDGEPFCDRWGDSDAALKNIVNRIETEGKVEVYSVGIETSCVRKYYSNNVVINDASELTAKLVELASGIFIP